jgi:hypothetical protein
MSASLLKADIVKPPRHVRFVPEADMAGPTSSSSSAASSPQRQPRLWLSLSETQSCWQLISNRAMLLPYARGL